MQPLPNKRLQSEIVTLIKQDAIEAGCLKEINHAKTIVKRGNSAYRQLLIYHKALGVGCSHAIAIKKVVDWLRRERLNF